MKNNISVFNEFFAHCWYNSFASIVCKNENYLNWIYKNSFNWIYEENNKKNLFNWKGSKFYCIRTDNLFSELNEILEIKAFKILGDVSGLIEEQIKLGNYLFVLCDQFYQVNHFEYNKSHNYHYSLIYGFDKEKGIYHVVSDFCANDQIMECDVSVDSFIQSKIMADKVNLGVKEFEQNIYIIKKKSNFMKKEYSLNIQDIIKNCSDLLDKKSEEENIVLGVEAIRMLGENISEIIEHERNPKKLIDTLASSFAVAAHNETRNKLLCDNLHRYKYIDEEGHKKMIDIFQRLKEEWDILELLMMKLVALNDKSIGLKLKNRLLVMYELEVEANMIFIKVLKDAIRS